MRKIIYADSVFECLVEEGQNHASKYGFRLGDTIKFSPSQVADIIEKMPGVKDEWIPIKTRPMTEEEKAYRKEFYEWPTDWEANESPVIFDCQMPEDGQEVWVCSKHGNVWQDTCEIDDGIWFSLEENGDWDDIVAWMPFKRPDPWKGKQMTYKEILDKFEASFPSAKIDDYRPVCHEIYEDGKVGCTIWLENGDMFVYYPAQEGDQ